MTSVTDPPDGDPVVSDVVDHNPDKDRYIEQSRPISHTFLMSFCPFSVTISLDTPKEYRELVAHLRTGGPRARDLADYLGQAQRSYTEEEGSK